MMAGDKTNGGGWTWEGTDGTWWRRADSSAREPPWHRLAEFAKLFPFGRV
jgi:hypothetical protein